MSFTTVSARRNFGGTTYAAPPSDPQPSPKKTAKFPPAVREYVSRCFASENAISGVTNEQMQARLKQIINDLHGNGSLESTNWDNLPLPQQMIVQDRTARQPAPRPHLQQPISDMTISKAVPSPTNKNKPKKRKSSEMMGDDNDDETQVDQTDPPWRQVKTRNVFEDRITFPTPAEAKEAKRNERKQRKLNGHSSIPDVSKSHTDLEKRRQRFGLLPAGGASPHSGGSRDDTPMDDAVQGPVVGTCELLEKRYFRLTSAPKPDTVRPQEVLEKTLELLKQKWRTDYNYSYICDQFKSMRQDLTVQHIKNGFTVNVYETHAHIALQKGDLGEYNQCQTQLRALHKQRLGGRPAEFLAYRILYFIYTGNRTDMNDALASVTPADRRVPAVKHALEVRSALALGNYHRFFRLYLSAPNMGPYLMDMFVVRERLSAMAYISKSYKMDVPLRFLSDELAFENEPDCAGFICDHGGEALLESREDQVFFLSSKAGQVFENARAAAFRRVDLKGQI